MNKKAMSITYNYFIALVIGVVVFIILLNILFNLNSTIISEADDVQCRNLLILKESLKAPILGTFLYEINSRCKVDNLKRVNNEDMENTLKPVGEMMKKCWYRYGEGEHDFLSNWDTEGKEIEGTTGGWCFKCAAIEYKDENGDKYKYSDLLDWMKLNEFEDKEGKDVSYFDYVNVMVTDTEEKVSIDKEVFDELSDEEKEIHLEIYSGQLFYKNVYDNKIIDPSEKLFVVYRFIRVDKDLVDSLFDFGEGSSSVIGGAAVIKPVYTGITTGSIKSSKGIASGIYSTANYVKEVTTDLVLKEPATAALRTDIAAKKVGKSALNVLKKHKAIAMLAATVGTAVSLTNANSVQYVDVMNQEEYYRECGTERFEN